jgi:putative DNA primase/helicase
MSGESIDRARGRWPEILPRLGVGTEFLRNRHGPCPLCGGRDRYRFDDRDGSGSYFCGQCGAGNGVILLRKLHGWDFKRVCEEIDAIIGSDARPEELPAKTGDNPDRRRRAIEKVLAGANDRRIVDSYLAGRGLKASSSLLRGHPALWHTEAKRSFPAVVAPITGPDNSLQSVQRIFIGPEVPRDARKTIMPPVNTISGGAVRLFEAGDELGISEGVETGLAAQQLFGKPTWATISEGGMTAFEPPAGVTRFHIFGDNDGNFVGQAAAYALAKRLVRLRYEVQVYLPPQPDTDWLDVLNERGAA